MSNEKPIMYIDPPSGWKYGFPKPAPTNIRELDETQLRQWLVDNGYPQSEVDYWVNSNGYVPYGMFAF